MSLIAVLAFKTGEIGIWGDTVVTRSSPIGPIVGKTSQGQKIAPRSNGNSVEYYDEGACKVGSFGNKTICGITTNSTDFAIEALILLEEEFAHPTNLAKLGERLEVVANSISGKLHSTAIAQFITVVQLPEGRFFCLIEFNRDEHGKCTVTKQCKKIILGEEWCDFFGSGKERLTDINRSGLRSIVDLYYSDSSLRSTFPFCISIQLSAWLRKEYNNEAPGFGGIFWGYLLTDQGITTTSDAMYIQANSNNDIEVFCKVTHGKQKFYLHNLINRHLTKFETLDGAMARYQRKNLVNTELEDKAVEFKAASIVLDLMVSNNPEIRDIGIIESPNGNALKYDLPQLNGTIYPAPGEIMNISTISKKDIKLRMPAYNKG